MVIEASVCRYVRAIDTPQRYLASAEQPFLGISKADTDGGGVESRKDTCKE